MDGSRSKIAGQKDNRVCLKLLATTMATTVATTRVAIAMATTGTLASEHELAHAQRPCCEPDGDHVDDHPIGSRVLALVHLAPRPSLGNGLSTRTLSWRGSVAPYQRDTASVYELLMRDIRVVGRT